MGELLLAFFLQFVSGAQAVESKTDKYQSFGELTLSEVEGPDYRIEVNDRKSPFTILAIHGGLIEPTTSEITRQIASTDLNFYLFEGLKKQGNRSLHLASHLFDEPQAVSLVKRSKISVSIHGFADRNNQWACLGGQNVHARQAIFKKLLLTGLLDQTVENPCADYWGTSDQNIVNLGSNGGVQLELSMKLRDLLKADRQRFLSFSNAIREALEGL